MDKREKLLKQSSVRQEIILGLESLLLGPLEENETLEDLDPQEGPGDFYLTGILWPRNTELAPEEDEKLGSGGDEDDDDSPEGSGAPLYSAFRPASMGITCTVSGITSPFEVIIKGARYLPIAVDGKGPESETPEGDIEDEDALSAPAMAEESEEPVEAENADDTSGGKRGGKDKNIRNCSNFNWKRIPFEYTYKVAGNETRAVWTTNNFVKSDCNPFRDPDVTLHLRRRVKGDNLIITASIINSATQAAEQRDRQSLYQTEITVRISTRQPGRIISRPFTALPQDEDDRVNELLYRNYREFAVGHNISATWPEPVDGGVDEVRTTWLPRQVVSSVSPDGHQLLKDLKESDDNPFAAAFLAEGAGEEITSRLGTFCDLYEKWLKEQDDVCNRLEDRYRELARQNVAGCRQALARMRDGVDVLSSDPLALKAFQLANLVMEKQSTSLKRQKQGTAGSLVWRPFQLAFILLALRSLVDRESPDRLTMDLLWFPTGGGKTEAYLALTAFTIFYRRLTVHEDRSGGQVDVLMRYTLRLLTVQQFQRAAAMICTADLVRRQDPGQLGETPISIGLFVGQAATPNKLRSYNESDQTSAEAVLKEERAGREPTSTPRLLLDCPLCGASLSPNHYQIDGNGMRINCTNLPDCPSKGDPLPVHTVDEEVYRVRPSLVIGTVDKFAQLPRNDSVGLLFGIPGLLPPEMIIQDELHLISGPLGTVTGLYETCIDELCSRDGIRPKIIGSTATIGRARQQVRALFNRDVMQFPPSATDADDSFFAVRDSEASDRVYMGLSSAGRSAKFTLQAASAVLLTLAKARYDDPGIEDEVLDPYWTCLLYFNSLRELGGAQVLLQDDVPRSVGFFASRIESKEKRELERPPVELTSRIPSTQIPKILRELEFPLEGDPFEGQAIDTVLASNMISVGVDVPRLGLMVVNGQPKSTSEFIQATSRVGRGIPGLILTVYNAARPRDLSHFEHFRNYHQAMYRRVEATSVTPWSARARDRALHAVFAALVRYSVPGMLSRDAAVAFELDRPEIYRIIDLIKFRASQAGLAHTTQEETEKDLIEIAQHWQHRAASHRNSGKTLEYWARMRPFDNRPVTDHLMRGAEENFENPEVWRTPNSMREVEPASYFMEWKKR